MIPGEGPGPSVGERLPAAGVAPGWDRPGQAHQPMIRSSTLDTRHRTC